MNERRVCPIMEVRWHDISPHGGGWKEHPEAIEAAVLVECRSVGYLIYDGEDRIVLAQNFNTRSDPEDVLAYSDTVAIPPGVIISRRQLAPAVAVRTRA